MTAQAITDEQLFHALHWLEDNAEPAAKARAHRVYLEKYEGHLLAKIAKECIDADMSAAKAEIYAKASDAYVKHVSVMETAIEADELLRWGRTHADAILEAWRTLSANRRAIEKAL